MSVAAGVMWTRASVRPLCCTALQPLTRRAGAGLPQVIHAPTISFSLCMQWRAVGGSTPVWRARQTPVGKARFPSKVPLSDGSARDVASLLTKAQSAASRGESRECLSFVWALKDSQPEWKAVRLAVEEASPRTLLHSIAEAGLEEPAKALLDFGVSVHTKDEDGMTALHLAAQGNHEKVAKHLLARGRAHVDTRDRHGRTPLHIATDLGHQGVSKVLMRFGASLQAINGEGKKPDPGENGGWLLKWEKNREKTSANVGKVQYFKALDSKLPAHVVAPELRLTPTGYCPLEDGTVKQLPRGIRFAKRRSAPSSPKGKVNWYAPRG